MKGIFAKMAAKSGEGWDSALGCFVPLTLLIATLISLMTFSLRFLIGFIPVL